MVGDENDWIDAVVPHAGAPSKQQKDAVMQAEKEKHDKYQEMVRDSDQLVKLVPFAVDSFGRLGEEGKRLIDRIAEAGKAHGSVADPAKFKRELLDRLAIVLQRHNASITRRWLVEESHLRKKERGIRALEVESGVKPMEIS